MYLSRTLAWPVAALFLMVALTRCTGCIKSMASAQHNPVVSPDQVQRLKQRTVVLILPVSESANIEEYKELIPKAWTLTPIEVIQYTDLDEYASQADKYAFFQLSGIKTTVTRSNGSSYSNTHYYVSLSVPYSQTNKKGKLEVKTDQLCRLEMYPDMQSVLQSFNKNLSDALYRTGQWRNFTLPYMMAYLRFVQKNIENGKNPWVYNNYSDKALRQQLLRDTLYVPKNLVFNRNKFNGKETQKDENFFADYGGKYRIVTNEELVSIIKNRGNAKPIFLFEYILSSTDKYVGVLEVNSGTIAYREYTSVSYNLKAKDIKGIID
jgi:hypothetical protein